MKPNEILHPSDFLYELDDLGHLMQVINDVLHEMEYIMADGSRNTELDRVAALHRIATDQLAHLAKGAERFDCGGSWMVAANAD